MNSLETPMKESASTKERIDMKSQANLSKPRPFPWGAIFGAAAVGGLAFAIAKKLQETRASAESLSIDSAMRACDRAAEALDSQLDRHLLHRHLAS